MEGIPVSAAWLAAVLAAGAMGFAIQRGGTCTVAAVAEVLQERRANRLLAMLEAALWVAGGLALARWAMWPGAAAAAYAASGWTVLGGALLGLGAWINRACVFGAVARLGSGEWAYVATPVGFWLGCLSVMPLFARPAAQPLPDGGTAALRALAIALAVAAALRLAHALWRLRGPGLARRAWRALWSPHGATVVIGLAFVATLLLAGRWAYTDVLADLAAAMAGAPRALALPLLLLGALYAGALLGGWRAGRWRPARPGIAATLRCAAGGVVMAWGSALIPGSNDGLILVGLPHGHLHAWLAFVTMCAAIAVAMRWPRGG